MHCLTDSKVPPEKNTSQKEKIFEEYNYLDFRFHQKQKYLNQSFKISLMKHFLNGRMYQYYKRENALKRVKQIF